MGPLAQRLEEEEELPVDVKDDNGRTPLSYACERGRLAATHWLLDRGE